LLDPEGARTPRARGPRPPPDTIVFALSDPIAPADIPRICERVRESVENSRPELVVCDVRGLTDPDAVAVDALARLELTARRCGVQITIRHALPELKDLLSLMGLTDVVPVCAESTLEPGRQPEEREPAGRVQEEGDAGDPIP
jgi:anti-anti-sigma regulatory factor